MAIVPAGPAVPGEQQILQLFRVLLPDPMDAWIHFLRRNLFSFMFEKCIFGLSTHSVNKPLLLSPVLDFIHIVDPPVDDGHAAAVSVVSVSPSVPPKTPKKRGRKKVVVLPPDARRSTRSTVQSGGFRLVPMQ